MYPSIWDNSPPNSIFLFISLIIANLPADGEEDIASLVTITGNSSVIIDQGAGTFQLQIHSVHPNVTVIQANKTVSLPLNTVIKNESSQASILLTGKSGKDVNFLVRISDPTYSPDNRTLIRSISPHEKIRKEKGTEITPTGSVAPYTPKTPRSVFFEDFDSIFDEFRRSFDNMMGPYFPAEFRPMKERAEFGLMQYAPLDLLDEGDHYRIQVEQPGMTKEDVEVNITNDKLSIVARKEEKSERNEKNYIHRVRYYSSSRRDIRFPEEVTPDKAEGNMKDGILEMKIPKREPKPKDILHKLEIK